MANGISEKRGIAYIGFLLLGVLGISGCIIINSGCSARESYSRTVELSAPMADESSLKVHTTNGSIIARGESVQTCSVIATVKGRASTKERAQELAEQTQVQLEPYDGGLRTVIVRTQKKKTESISVGFDVTVPTQTSLNAVTTNGKVEASLLTGDLTAHTTNGNVRFNQVRTDRMDAHTTNGSIACEDVTGILNAVTTNGSVRVAYAPQADAATDISITTTNGSVVVALPQNYSAKVVAGTTNGKIKSEVPVTVQGQISKTSLNGQIGAGDGKLSLRTTNGSIEIR